MSNVVSATKRTGKVQNDERADWRRPGPCFPARSRTSGTGRCTLPPSPRASSPAASTSGPDHLGQGAAGAQPRRLSLAARALLVRGAQEGQGHWSGDRKQTTLWQIPAATDAATVHGTQKPVECMRRPMLNNSAPGQAVYEPFSGSGTKLIAAETCGRICLAMELDPAYVDVAVIRWQAFTGEATSLDGDGRSFAEIAAERSRGREPGAGRSRPRSGGSKATAASGLGTTPSRPRPTPSPVAPALAPVAKKEWRRSPALLHGMGVLTSIDRARSPPTARPMAAGWRPRRSSRRRRRSTRRRRATCSSRPGSASSTSSSN